MNTNMKVERTTNVKKDMQRNVHTTGKAKGYLKTIAMVNTNVKTAKNLNTDKKSNTNVKTTTILNMNGNVNTIRT